MKPLRGTTVADLSRYLPGPYASRELLRLGARVVKIEPPEGDPARHASPGPYEVLNRGKEIVTWDARSEAQPSVLLEADVDPTVAAWALYGAHEEILTGWVLGQLPAGEADVERAVATVVEIAYAGLAA